MAASVVCSVALGVSVFRGYHFSLMSFNWCLETINIFNNIYVARINEKHVGFYRWILTFMSSQKCSQKFCKFHRKVPVLEYLFYKVAALQTYNFIKKRLQHRCFLWNLWNWRTPIFKNIWEQLLLNFDRLRYNKK